MTAEMVVCKTEISQLMNTGEPKQLSTTGSLVPSSKSEKQESLSSCEIVGRLNKSDEKRTLWKQALNRSTKMNSKTTRMVS
jgi:hypothetical protein